MAPRTILLAAAVLLSGTVVLAAQKDPARPASTPPPAEAAHPTMLPDLLVVSIDFKNYHVITAPDGTKTGIAYPAFTVKNGGKVRNKKPFDITWEYWDHASQTWQTLLGQYFTDQYLDAGQSNTIGGQPSQEISWTPGVNQPRFRVRIDTLRAVTESNELNNEMTKTFMPLTAAPKPVAVPIPKIYSTYPASVLVLDMATWQSPIGWPFSICANEQVEKNWEGWVTLNGASMNTPMVWYTSIPNTAPACPAGQVKRSYWVVLDGQPAPGDYKVRLGPQQPGKVTVPLTLRVPGAAYQERSLKPPIRPN